jgi:hypothetical protein
MKKLFGLGALLLALVSFSNQGFAYSVNQTGTLGLGVNFGEVTGVTGKIWQHPDDAIDVMVGGSSDQKWLAQASYEKHFLQAFGTSSKFVSEMAPYIGGGVGAGFNRTINNEKRSSDIFLRLPVGIAWLPDATPLDVFVEVAPTVDVTPVTFTYLTANLGARYYF